MVIGFGSKALDGWFSICSSSGVGSVYGQKDHHEPGCCDEERCVHGGVIHGYCVMDGGCYCAIVDLAIGLLEFFVRLKFDFFLVEGEDGRTRTWR